MSELQLGLLAVGIGIVAAVFGYNKWQEARYRREAEANIARPGEDVLLHSPVPAAGRREPTLEADEPTLPDIVPPGEMTAAPPAPAVLSQAIDFIVEMEADPPMRGAALLAAATAQSGRPAKSVHWEGDSGSGWEALRPDGWYGRVRAGMQLVDRKGPVSEQDLEAFEAGVTQAASTVRARVAPPELGAALRAAASLDRFCGEVDIQIAVHVIPAEQPFQGTNVRALAEAAGLSLERDGRFRLRDEQGRALFSLANEAAAAPFSAADMRTLQTTALLVELDVPRAPGAAFARFRDFALHAASALGGSLVDDNRSVLKAASFEAIAAQLQPVYESMQAQGLAAGSPLALRLFS